MKKVVIICILSLSLCLGQAQPTGASAKNTTIENNAIGTTLKPDEPQKLNSNNSTILLPEHKESVVTQATVKPEEKAEDKPTVVNKTQPDSTKNETVVSTEKAAPLPSTTQKPMSTTPAEAKSTTPLATVPPTPHPKDNVTDKPTVQSAGGFNGPSFIGGIILTLGLLAIGFMGFKYYKNQTERNYHTL